MASQQLAAASLQQEWNKLVAAQPHPPHWIVLVTAGVALLAVLYRPVWRPLRTVVTIAHEGGHALAALLSGRRLSGIRLHSDTSGVTVSVGRTTGPGMVFTALAGYVTPSLLGALGTALLVRGHVTMALWAVIALIAVMLPAIRNWYGAFALVAVGGAVLAVAWLAGTRAQATFAYLLVWFLLFAGARPVVELQQMRMRGRAPWSDADQLASLTRVPAAAWVTVFGAVAVLSLAWGAGALIR